MKRNLSFLSSLLLVLSYTIFSLISFLNFPSPYAPTTHWLSDLGSPTLNPQGWFYYDIGITCAGILLVVFFWGFSVWKNAENKKQHTMLRLALGFGIAGGLCMILSAVFPINIPGIHSFFSASLYILIGTSFVFAVISLVYYPKFPKWMILLGFLIAIEDLAWSIVLNIYIMEWITVGLFLLFVFLLGIHTRNSHKYMDNEKT